MPSQSQSIVLGALVTALLGVLLAFFAQGGGQASATIAGIAACCLPALAGSIMSVWHYTDTHGLTLASGAGAKLGAIAGAIGSVISTVLSLLLRFVGVFPGPDEQLEIARQRLVDQGMSEQQIEQALQFSQNFSSPAAQAGFALVAILAFALIGAAGGAAASALFKKGGNEPTVYEP